MYQKQKKENLIVFQIERRIELRFVGGCKKNSLPAIPAYLTEQLSLALCYPYYLESDIGGWCGTFEVAKDAMYCDICKITHPVENFEYVTKGWVEDNKKTFPKWLTLKCLISDREFTIHLADKSIDNVSKA